MTLIETIAAKSPITNVADLFGLQHSNPLGIAPLWQLIAILAVTLVMEYFLHQIRWHQKPQYYPVLYSLLGVLLVASVVIFIILNKKKAEEDDIPLADDNSWACPACGSRNQGRFCQNCGQAKPVGALQYACDKCGWEPEDPTHPPKFCPECGDPFGDEDVIR